LKYQSLLAFENHLKEAYPSHFSRAYMILFPDITERKRLCEKIAELLKGESQVFSLEEQDGSSFLDLLQTRSLFASHSVVVLEGIDHLTKKEVACVSEYLKNPSPFVTLILSGPSFSGAQDLYQQGKKELVLLDMTAEKPWDKKDRLKRWLLAEALRQKKALTEECALFLLEHVGTERSSLEQELFKLITFAYDRKTLTLSDAQAIVSKTQELGLWKIAEHLIWDEKPISSRLDPEMASLLALLAYLRTQVDLGLRLSDALQKGMPPQVPSLKPQVLSKYLATIKTRRSDFFVKAFSLIYETELMAKDQPFSPDFLYDILQSKLQLLKL
jgi:DNA polymerase III delta subunit